MSGPWEKYGEPEEQQAAEEGPWNKYGETLGERAMADATNMGVMGESMARGFFDNVMNVPNAIGDVVAEGLAWPTAAVHTIGSGMFDMLTGEPRNDLAGHFSRNLEAARNARVPFTDFSPVATLREGYDAPTSLDVQAGATSLASSMQPVGVPGQLYTPPQKDVPASAFREERDELLEGYLQRREDYPVGAATGDILADVATLYSGRAPVGNLARQKRLLDMKQAKAPAAKMDPGFKRWATRKADEYAQWFKETGYTIAETGIEGAMLAALQDEDPIASAAFGAGVQTVNNVANRWWDELGTLGTKDPGVTRTGLKVGVTAFALGSLFQLFKEITPGGRDRILESEESGYRKVAIAMAVGAMTNAAGFSRPTRTQLDDLGLVVDTWHSARRGSVMSLFSEIENDDSGDIDRVWSKIAEDPNYFDTTALRRLNRAFESDRPGSNGDAIESLMEADRKFRRKVLALREQQ